MSWTAASRRAAVFLAVVASCAVGTVWAQPAAGPAGAGELGGAPAPAEPPRLVKSRFEAHNITATRDQNEWNPRFTPDGSRLSFERRSGSAQAIFILETTALGAEPLRVSSNPPRTDLSAEELLLGGGPADESFNTQISFWPDGQRFIFTGNGDGGVYRLYKGSIGGSAPGVLVSRSKEDGHPAVSPDGKYLVYVSARAGVGKLFLRNLTTGEERQLNNSPQIDLYPVWSPDSSAVAYISGDNDNHDIFVIRDVTMPTSKPIQLTLWRFDDLRPTFSSDGTRIAFYSNYNPEFEDKVWSIVVVLADGSGPKKGQAMARNTVAVNVVKDSEVGPAWVPGARSIVYARNLKKQWNPVYLVDTDSREERRVRTGTRMNHDLTCSASGRLAFRAQVASWDDIFVADLFEPTPAAVGAP